MKRSTLVGIVAAALLLPLQSAADLVTRIIVPASPGGPMDALARLISPELAKTLGRPVIVENRAGAQAAVGAESVARAPADGATLLMGAPYLASNAVGGKPGLDPQRDLAPVALISHSFLYLVAHESTGIRSVEDMRRVAQARGKPLSCASGPGSMAVACEVLKSKLAGQVIPAPYPGVAPAVVALLGGHVDLAFVAGSGLAPMANNPAVHVVASLGSATPAKPLDTLPLLKQTWPDWSTQTFYGLFAPAGTPAETIKALNAAVNQVLAEPRVAEAVAGMGDRVVTGPPERLQAQLAAELAYYRKVSAQVGARQ